MLSVNVVCVDIDNPYLLYAFMFKLSVVMLNVIKVRVIMLNVEAPFNK
jgi:hypothetical protein